MKVFIYALLDPRTAQVRYVGKAVDVHARVQNHVCPSGMDERTHRAAWLRLLRKLGLRPVVQVLEEVDESCWQERERFWIAHYKEQGADLTNMLPGGEGGATYGRRGKPWTDEHREAYRRSRLGVPIAAPPAAVLARSQANKAAWATKRAQGIKKRSPQHTEEWKQQMSVWAKERAASGGLDYLREASRRAKLGKKQSQETVEKRAAKLRGRKKGPLSEEHRAALRAGWVRRREAQLRKGVVDG